MTTVDATKLLRLADRDIQEHRLWLKSYGVRHENEWEARLRNTPEAAIAEACVRLLITKDLSEIRPPEVPGQGGLDFYCQASLFPHPHFYVECTCFEDSTCSSMTGLPEAVEDWSGGGIVSIAKKFQARAFLTLMSRSCNRPPIESHEHSHTQSADATLHDHDNCSKRLKKQNQVTKHSLQAPVVLAIASTHETTSFVHFLSEQIAGMLLPRTALRFSYEPDITHQDVREVPLFGDSFFFKQTSANAYAAACPEISAVLLLAIPWRASNGSGRHASIALNPTAQFPFSSTWLPSIPCCQLDSEWKETNPCKWKIEWVNQ